MMNYKWMPTLPINRARVAYYKFFFILIVGKFCKGEKWTIVIRLQDEEFISDVDITISGVSEMVDNYFGDIEYDSELLYDRDFGSVDEIDLIFNR